MTNEMEIDTRTSNAPITRESMLSTVGELGQAAGVGRDALANVAYEVALGVQYGVFVTKGEKNNTDPDTQLVWDTYVAGETKKADGIARSANAVKAAISKLQQVANATHKLVKMDRHFASDVMAPVIETRKALRADGIDVKPLFDCFVSAARLQFAEKQTAVVTEKQISDLCRKAAKKSPLVLDIVEHARKKAANLSELLNHDDDVDALAEIEAAFQRILAPKTVQIGREEADEFAAFKAAKAAAIAAAEAKAVAEAEAAAQAQIKADNEADVEHRLEAAE